jgi:hypothetical protein
LSELDSAPDLLRALNRVVSGDTPSADPAIAVGRNEQAAGTLHDGRVLLQEPPQLLPDL